MTRRKAALALFALSVGGFGIGLTEFVIAGLLTEVATDLGVTISQAGHLVGVYALAVVPGALLITPFLMRRPPKYALAVLLAFFVVGNLLSAWAPTYEVMLAGRIVAALAHGGYFGIGAVLAASLVPPSKRASAVAALFAGLTIANVLGVPAGALVGQQYGWRMVFWIISALGLIALAGLIALVPKTEPERDQLPVAQQFKALARPQVLASLLTTALVFGGMFGVFTYIEPLLREVTGYSATAIPWLLVIFGAGLFAGNILGGKAADRNADNAVLILSILLPIVILTLGAVASMPVPVAIGLFLLGLVGFATVPGLQARVMRHAHGAATLASATNIAAFNLGNTIGVSLAGAAIAAGYGLVSPTVVGAGLTVIGLAVIVVARIAARRQASSSARHINSAI
ncbi:MFS transporter [Microbacterium lacticum]|uniref:MFS transporter n=1 Tax=Microbacterium lacticum TaxID=33885 RepID=UPI0011724ECF|nr:MFS transporter [Microbacterium lacticum]GEB96310.1 MFS transporter [Microbacterium lacticum]GGI73451.1 MFS transporter [Microbacterium lacticum]